MSGLSEDELHELRMGTGQSAMAISDALENGGIDLIEPLIDAITNLRKCLEEQGCNPGAVGGMVMGTVLSVLYDPKAREAE